RDGDVAEANGNGVDQADGVVGDDPGRPPLGRAGEANPAIIVLRGVWLHRRLSSPRPGIVAIAGSHSSPGQKYLVTFASRLRRDTRTGSGGTARRAVRKRSNSSLEIRQVARFVPAETFTATRSPA